MQEWEALRERQLVALEREDYLHARTASAMCGKAPKDLMVIKSPPKLLLGPDGRPVTVSFDALVGRMGGPDPE